jgi:hypothetical protein
MWCCRRCVRARVRACVRACVRNNFLDRDMHAAGRTYDRQDHVTQRNRGFAFVMFKDRESVEKVVTQNGLTKLHEIKTGKYVEVKRANAKAAGDCASAALDAHVRSSTKPRMQNICMDCGKRNPKFCMPNENKKRWCGECAQKNHPEAVKTRTMKERPPSHFYVWRALFHLPATFIPACDPAERQREDRCAVFR